MVIMQKQVRIFGVPMDLGQNRRGVDMGPSAIRYAQLGEKLQALGYITHDEGNIIVSQAEETPEDYEIGNMNAHYLPEVTQVCQATYDAIMDCWQGDDFGLFIGGDHSISIGTISAVAQRKNIGVLWVDAHTDMNTPETSPSGNIHGMSVAVLLGKGSSSLVNIGSDGATLKPKQVAMIGVRDVDRDEAIRVRDSGITVHTMRQVDEQGIPKIAEKVFAQFADRDYIHVSFDLDSCDPRHVPGVGTPVMGGLTYREAHLLMELLADSGKVCSMDVVECNPILDNRNATAEIAVEMILSILGKNIL
jgi:arginase